MTLSFGYSNLIYDADVTALSESSAFPVSNLNLRRLNPAYRSDSHFLSLNGTSQGALLADHADFDVDSFTIEWCDAGATQGAIFSRRVTAGNYSYAISITGNNIRIRLSSDGTNEAVITTDTNFVDGDIHIYKVSFFASVPRLFVWCDHVVVASATNATQTGCTLTGTIPTSLYKTNENIYVGTLNGTATFYDGNIQWLAFAKAARENSGYLDPDDASTVGHWKFENDLTDSSGQGHTLTAIGGPLTYTAKAGIQYLSILNLGGGVNPTFYFDKHHNMNASYHTIKIWRPSGTGNPFGQIEARGTITVAGDTALVGAPTSGTSDDDWILEIVTLYGDTNTYVEIPFVFVGILQTTTYNWVNDIEWSEQANIQARETLGGAKYGIQTTIDELYKQEGGFEPLDATDQRIMEATIQAGKRGTVPIVYKDENGVYRTVYISQDKIAYKQDSTVFKTYPKVKIEECGNGVY